MAIEDCAISQRFFSGCLDLMNRIRNGIYSIYIKRTNFDCLPILYQTLFHILSTSFSLDYFLIDSSFFISSSILSGDY